MPDTLVHAKPLRSHHLTKSGATRQRGSFMTIAAAESHVSNAPLPDASFYHAVIAAHTNAQKKAECSGDDDGLECVSSMHDVVAEMRFAGFELDATSVQEHDYDIARDCLQ